MTHGRDPDFICIGAQKAGTRWLYDQLEHHPEFWMPPVKELQFFGQEQETAQRARKLLKALRRDPAALAAVREADLLRPLDAPDAAWLRTYLNALAERHGDPIAYRTLFTAAGDKLSGDISPPYSMLDRTEAQAIRASFPDTRIVYLARDPIERAWSQFCMFVRKRRPADAVPPMTFEQFLALPGWRVRSSMTFAVDAWRRSPDDPRFAIFFLDDIEAEPEITRARILAFLGADPALSSGPIDPGFNRKAEMAKLVIGEAERAALLTALSDEIAACARRFGGPALRWARRYGISG